MESILKILNQIGYNDLKDCGQEWRTKPLYRHSDNHTSLVIKKETGLWYDFSERCGGSLLQLVQKTLNLKTFNEAKNVLKDHNIEIEKDDKKHVSFIMVQKTFSKDMLSRLNPKHDYWLKRGISEETIKKFNGGITFNGVMTNRYVFPIFNDKRELVGFSGRLLEINPNFPKWKLIGQKTQWVYPAQINRFVIQEKKEVILVESIGDMLSLYECGIENVLVTFGLDLGQKILQFLLKMDIQKITIALNNDEGNGLVANKAAIDMKDKLVKYFDEEQINVVTPPDKDFNEWLLSDKQSLIDFWNK